MIFIILGISFFTGVNLFAQDENENNTSNKPENNDKNRFFIRGGIGVQGGFGVFFPADLNQYTKDFWNNLINQYYPSGDYPGNDPVIRIIMGLDYQVKAVLRLINVFQLEAYKEGFYGIGLQFKSDLYSYGYDMQYQQISATYQFVPGYTALGANLLFTPGARRKPVFFTIGGGIAEYTGTLKYHEEGSQEVNDQTTSFNNTRNYKGDVLGYTGTIGTTYVPWKFLEFEVFLTGRLAKIPELRDEEGNTLVNPYRDNKIISLDFSGIDLRIGLKFIFP
jgi:hypothetical protein